MTETRKTERRQHLLPGPKYKGKNVTEFLVWAPTAETAEVHVFSPPERIVRLKRRGDGYFCSTVEWVGPGALYKYRINSEEEFPDPASRFQPAGVHGPSQVLDPEYEWADASWTGVPLEKYIIYEMHIGTYTAEGTFEAAIRHLEEIHALGITALEIMPVAQFPGTRNWGYDGVYPYAVQNSYGGPTGFKRFVDAAHRHGLAVVLDVVYNHLGPEGNYLARFGPYFTSRYDTPWGVAVNFDGPGCEAVRDYYIGNALYWISEFHLDALRLDAVHAIHDSSRPHILADIARAVRRRGAELNRSVQVFAESDMNDARIVRPAEQGGYGLDAQWSDDFHHSLHTVLTGENGGYYADFGRIADLAKAFAEGFVYTGQFSKYRNRHFGTESRHLSGRRFVVCSENHDQVGNRMLGDRMSARLSLEGLKLAAGALILSPFLPLVFMGQEYGEAAPFLYFVSHTDPALVEAVRAGRRKEFAAFAWQGEVPDPQAEKTYLRSRLNHGLKQMRPHSTLLEFYRAAISLRTQYPSLAALRHDAVSVAFSEESRVVSIQRAEGAERSAVILNFDGVEQSFAVVLEEGIWRKTLDSAEEQWSGTGSPLPWVLESEGAVTFRVPPKTVCVFVRSAYSDPLKGFGRTSCES